MKYVATNLLVQTRGSFCELSLNILENVFEIELRIWKIEISLLLTVIKSESIKEPSYALYTLAIQYCYTQTQCEDDARDVRILLLTRDIFNKADFANRKSCCYFFKHILNKKILCDYKIVRNYHKFPGPISVLM